MDVVEFEDARVGLVDRPRCDEIVDPAHVDPEPLGQLPGRDPASADSAGGVRPDADNARPPSAMPVVPGLSCVPVRVGSFTPPGWRHAHADLNLDG